jgi:hypothetical protein
MTVSYWAPQPVPATVQDVNPQVVVIWLVVLVLPVDNTPVPWIGPEHVSPPPSLFWIVT